MRRVGGIRCVMMLAVYDKAAALARINILLDYSLVGVAFFLPLSLGLSTAALVVAALAWLAKMHLLQRFRLATAPFNASVLALAAVAALSILVSPDREFSFYNYYNLFGRYLLVYFLVVNNVHTPAQVRRLVQALLLSGTLVAAYGLVQYVHGAVDPAQMAWIDGEQFPDLKFRIYGTMENPNLLAGFLVAAISLVAGEGLTCKRGRRRWLLWGTVLIMGSALVLTYSRSAWLSVLVVVLLFGVIYNRRLLWLFLLLPAVVVGAHDTVAERLLSILNPTDTSCTLRLALWESTWAMILDHPWLGIGWGAYWLVYPAYDFFIGDNSVKIVHAHNMYLNIAAEIGIPGLLLFLWIMAGHIIYAWRLWHRLPPGWRRGLVLGLMGALVSLAVSGFADYIMFNIQVAMLFWLLNALVVAGANVRKEI